MLPNQLTISEETQLEYNQRGITINLTNLKEALGKTIANKRTQELNIQLPKTNKQLE